MHRRAVLAVVVLLSATTAGVVGYRLADPEIGGQSAGTVDFSDSPDEIAYAALAQTDERDYVVEWSVTNDEAAAEDDGPVRAGRMQVENSDGQVAVNRTPPETLHSRAFANRYCHWTRWDRDPWRRDCSFSDPALPDVLTGHEDALFDPDATVTVLARNETAVVLRVNDTDTAHLLAEGDSEITDTGWARREDYRANLTLVVDRDTGRLRRLVFFKSWNDTDPGRRWWRFEYRFSEWGETEVERPTSAGYTLAEFLLDVLD